MKKIMFMINGMSGGGAEKILQTLLLQLDYNKYDVTVYSMHRENIAKMNYPKEIHYKVIFDEYNGSREILRKFGNIRTKVKGKVFQVCPSTVFYRLFIHEKYDVEVAFIEGESTKIISGSSNRYSKKYAWVHIDLIQNPWTSFLYGSDIDEANHYKKFDRILCVSQAVKNSFLKKYDTIESTKIKVQYNPINRDEIIAMSKEKCSLEKKKKLRMVAVGRLVRQKVFDRLLDVCSKLQQKGYRFELFILGDGEERANLENIITSLNLERNVFLLGYLSNPYAVMNTADLLVCSSRSEGFSTVLAEGVVLGLPIVSTECAGVQELFGDTKCGIIVNNDEENLYQGLKLILDNPVQLELYKRNSFERGKMFALSKTVTEIEQLLDE